MIDETGERLTGFLFGHDRARFLFRRDRFFVRPPYDWNLTLRSFILSAALLACVQCPAHAAPRDLHAELAAADKALAAKDYPAAYRAYAEHAGDNGLAQFTLGLFEQQGWGRPANAVAACAWFDKASTQHMRVTLLYAPYPYIGAWRISSKLLAPYVYPH